MNTEVQNVKFITLSAKTWRYISRMKKSGLQQSLSKSKLQCAIPQTENSNRATLYDIPKADKYMKFRMLGSLNSCEKLDDRTSQ